MFCCIWGSMLLLYRTYRVDPAPVCHLATSPFCTWQSYLHRNCSPESEGIRTSTWPCMCTSRRTWHCLNRLWHWSTLSFSVRFRRCLRISPFSASSCRTSVAWQACPRNLDCTLPPGFRKRRSLHMHSLHSSRASGHCPNLGGTLCSLSGCMHRIRGRWNRGGSGFVWTRKLLDPKWIEKLR